MNRAEKAGLGVALVGHVILFGLLSVGFLATPNPKMLESDPVDVQFVDEVGLKSAFPEKAVEPPAESVAPEIGKPEDSAPPEPTPDEAPIEPAPAPAPKLVPKPLPKQAPPKPASAAPAKQRDAPAKPAAKALPSPERGKSAGTGKSAQPQRGSRLGKDFLKGIADKPTRAQGKTPRAATVGAVAMNGLAQALKRQFQPCYELGSLGGTGAMQINTVLRLRFRKDGSIAAQPQVVEQSGVSGGNGAYAQQMAEVARRAVLRCSPIRLPAELYAGGWDDFELNFIPGQLS